MKGLLVHGCYDQATLRTLETVGVEAFAFDLRSRSTNLVPYKTLRELLGVMKSPEAVLMFADDSRETIFSFLDLLKDSQKSFLLEFRDKKSPDFYESLGCPFIWYFSPDADWMRIMSLKNCEGVVLPLHYQDLYHSLPHLWTLIEERHLRIWLHAENFTEAEFFAGKQNIQASLDLTREVEHSYRTVNQLLLKNQKLWRKYHESAAGQ